MKRFLILLGVCTLLAAMVVSAEAPKTISYQALLRDTGGGLLPDDDYVITFRIYDYAEEPGGGALWTETDTLAVANGLLNAILGKVNSIDLDFDVPYWLGVEIEGGGELAPRMELSGGPYAFRAAVSDSAAGVLWSNILEIPAGFADGVDDVGAGSGDGHSLDAADGDPVDAVYVDDEGNVGIGTTTPGQKLEIRDGSITIAQHWDNVLRTRQDGKYYQLIGTYGGFNPDVVHIAAYNATNHESLSTVGVCIGGFEGNGIYVDIPNGRTGIGTSTPSAKLDVNGSIKTTGFQMTSSPGNGYVLMSDADGAASWQPSPGGVGGGGSSGTIPIWTGSTTLGNSSIFTGWGNYGIGTVSDSTSFTVREVYIDGDPFPRADHLLILQDQRIAAPPFGYLKDIFSVGRTGDSKLAGRMEIEGGSSTSPTLNLLQTASTGTALKAQGGADGLAAQFLGNVEIKNQAGTQLLLEFGEGLDYAEGFDVSGKDVVSSGSVLIIDPESPGELCVSREPYDRRVAGIAAGANNLGSGVRLGAGGHDLDVALAGRVYCNVDATEYEVRPGDLLTTSPLPGYAMKVTDHDRAPGAVLGKAMEPLAKGEKGQILVLVTLQ
ncbi:MAG: hypothetical protein ABIK65_14580 [Candidatus Eisenbacteria bacterium]